jgi:hypothetical protein
VYNSPRMRKNAFSLTPQQVEWLHEEAKRLGISISELLRRIIDERRQA